MALPRFSILHAHRSWSRDLLSVVLGTAVACGQAARLTPGHDDRSRGQNVSANTTPAPWLESALPEDTVPVPFGGSIVAIGEHTALAGAPPATVAVDAKQGVLGRIAIPAGTMWVGLGTRDQVIAATDSGTVSRADSPSDAIAGRFSGAASVPGARLWTAAPGLVVAATADRVFVSTDDATTFVETPFRASDPVQEIHARFDGVIVVRVGEERSPLKSKTLISRDRGRSWTTSAYQPYRIEQLGSWISEGSSECSAHVAKDGAWRISARDVYPRIKARFEEWPVGFTSDLPRYRELLPPWTAIEAIPSSDEGPVSTHPCRSASGPPPAPPPDSFAATSECLSCTGPACLREPSVPETATSFALLDDGVCEQQGGDCTSPPIRQPHAAVFDQTSATVLALPDGCDPARIVSARGLGLLLCHAAGGVTVFAIDRQHRWEREEVMAETSPRALQLSIADDGTIALSRACKAEDRCRAWVRRPLAVGAKNAWSTIEHAGFVGFRALGRGRVMGIEVASRGDLVDVTLSSVDEGGLTPLGSTTAEAPLLDVEAHGDAVYVNGEPLAHSITRKPRMVPLPSGPPCHGA